MADSDEDDLVASLMDDELTPSISGKSEKERHLEQIVLGRAEDFEQNLDLHRKAFTFAEDVDAVSDTPKTSAAAWHDEDDLDNVVDVRGDRRYKRFRTEDESRVNADLLSKRLRNEFERNMPVPDWAKPKAGKDDLDADILSRRTGSYIEKSTKQLPLRTFRYKRLTNMNFESSSKGFVHAVEFHPSVQMALVGAFGRTVDLFEIDGKSNPRLKSVFFERFPISDAHFLDRGSKFLACSKVFPHMFTFDLQSEKSTRIPWNKAIAEEGFKSFQLSPDGNFMAFPGKDGSIQLLSGKSVEWIKTLKMNGSVAGLAFSGDSKYLYSIGDSGMVYIWDVKARKCLSTFMDDGCVSGTTVAASGNGKLLAVGSNTGIVNVYEGGNALTSAKPNLLKIISNMTTSITALKFNPSSEILAMASNYQNTLKLFHTGEMQVIPSFPAANQQIRQPQSLDFSPNSGYMAVGNNKSEAQLFRLFDYKGY